MSKMEFNKEEGRFVKTGFVREKTQAELDEDSQKYEEGEREAEIRNTEIESGIEEILAKIDAPRLRDEAMQEAKEKGLLNEEDSLPSERDAQKRLLDMIEERKIVESARKLVDETQDEKEKEFAFELINQYESYLYQLQMKHTQIARQNDMARERFAGELTAETEIQALEDLQKVGVMTEDELSERKTRLVEQLEKGLRL